MRFQGKALLKALLTRSEHGEQLFRFLPPKIAEEIQGLPKPQSLDFTSLLSTSRWLDPIHYSWFYPFLKKLPEDILALFISLFTPAQVKGINEMLNSTTLSLSPSPFVTPFLLNYLKGEIQKKEIVNEEQLPFSEMNNLLQLKREEMLHLIDLLGIYDLAADLRQIVDKELLEKIYVALNRDQLHFLHYCTKQSIKWVAPKLGLAGWDGTKKTLNSLLHQRGLTWLARAITEESTSFRWHLLHHLDTRRAKIILNTLEQKQDSALTTYFKNQVLHIAKRFQT